MKPRISLGEDKCANGIIIGLFHIYDSHMVFAKGQRIFLNIFY